MAAPHMRTPAIPGGKLRLIDEVVAFDPEGGPWGRGYLRATAVGADRTPGSTTGTSRTIPACLGR